MFTYNTIDKINYEILFRFIFFIFLFLIGIYFFSQFGVTMDEEYIKNNGLLDYNFIKNIFFNYDTVNFEKTFSEYLKKSGKFSGFFYTIVFFVNDLIKNYIDIDIYKIAHLLNFSIFILSCVCFFKIILIRFGNKTFSYLSVLIIFTTPRIFAESFYNNRDIYYLSINLINLYFIQKLFLDFNFKNILIFSLISGMCINARLFGLLILFLVFLFLILEYEDKISKRKLISNLTLITLITFIFLILLTPYLWLNPLNNFIEYYFNDSYISSNILVTNLFLGNLYSSLNTPWYFYIVWIFFTIPVIFLFLIIMGLFLKIIFFSKRILNLIPNRNLWVNNIKMFDLFVLISLVLTVFGMSRFSPVNYDGWRHLYFLYPLLVLNIFYILNFLLKNHKFFYLITLFFLSFNIFFNFYWIKKNHPYQFVYFNFFNEIFSDKKFDLDYWGLTNYQAYQFILNDSKGKKSSVGTLSFNNLIPNYNILKEGEKKKIYFITAKKNPDYLIDNYRFSYKIYKTNMKSELIKNYKIVYQIIINGNIINTVYKKYK